MEQTLNGRFEQSASKHGRRTAIRYKKDGKWSGITYGELQKAIKAVAVLLSEAGVRKGDRVAVLLENRLEWPVVFFASLLTGAVCVPVKYQTTQEEIEGILGDSGSKIIFVNSGSFLFEEKNRAKFPFLKKVISVDSPAFRDMVREEPHGKIPCHETTDEEIACILYTSGTTARPKGVMLSHRNLLSNCDSLYRRKLFDVGHATVSVLPLYDSYPLMVTMFLPLMYGAEIIYPVGMRADAVLEAMLERNPNSIAGVPQLFCAFHKRITDALENLPFPLSRFFKLTAEVLYGIRKKTGFNLARYFFWTIQSKLGKSMRFFISGGAKLDEKITQDLFKFGFTLLEGYGLTETSPVLSLNPIRRPKIGSVGLPIEGVEIEILNKNKDGIGEIRARGPNIMKGYYNRPEMTKSVLRDGWFYTGDLGYSDDDGYIFLTGRSKDVIVLSSGINVHPAEIESVYAKDVPLREVCILEVPSGRSGGENQVLWAVVRPDYNFFREENEEDVRKTIKHKFEETSKKLPDYNRIMGFSLTREEFPRTMLGKMKRYAIREHYLPRIAEERKNTVKQENVSTEDRKFMQKDVAQKVINCLCKQTGLKNILPQNSLELDLGIDYVARIDLAWGLGRIFKIKIEDKIIRKVFTVRELIEKLELFLSAEGANRHR